MSSFRVGRSVWVWDIEGKWYLDCLSAYSAVNQGHCHPRIRNTLIEQSGRLTLTSRAFRNDQLPLFYEEVCALTRSHKVLPMNSGAEAVESAIKTVRKWGYDVKGVPPGCAEIIVCAGNFHGRTIAIIGFSDNPSVCGAFGPFAPGFKVIPFARAKMSCLFLMRFRLGWAAPASCSPKNTKASNLIWL
jgi:ornithine--oxo-acid transaminase